MASRANSEFSTGKSVRIPKTLRAELEAAIEAHLMAVERLTTVLDRADGDPDREPALGALQGWGASFDQRDWAYSDDRDLEDQCEDEGAQCDDEGVRWTGPMPRRVAP